MKHSGNYLQGNIFQSSQDLFFEKVGAALAIESFSKLLEMNIILSNVVGKIIKMAVRYTKRDTNYRHRVKNSIVRVHQLIERQAELLVEPLFSLPCALAEKQDY